MTTIIDAMRSWLHGEPVPPYNEILDKWGIEFMMYRDALLQNIYNWRGGSGGSIEAELQDRVVSLRLRDRAVELFGFSIPCAEILDALAEHQPILEVGAGTGYWTALMRHRGIKVMGTDPNLQHWWKSTGRYDPVQINLQAKTAIRRYPERTVFCSWPSLGETWFRQAMKVMRHGQRMILIEEDACAEESTWDYRDRYFSEEKYIGMPAWWGMNDRCRVWRKT